MEFHDGFERVSFLVYFGSCSLGRLSLWFRFFLFGGWGVRGGKGMIRMEEWCMCMYVSVGRDWRNKTASGSEERYKECVLLKRKIHQWGL